MLNPGICGEAQETVNETNIAGNMGSGDMRVYATPAMIALIEKAAWMSVAGELESGQSSVGTLINVSHLAATPVGMKVTAKTELIKVEGRKLTFHVECYDECEKIGEGTHERMIVSDERFLSRVNAKHGD